MFFLHILKIYSIFNYKATIIYLGKTTPTVINSTGPRLVILFKAGSKPGSGFKANYYFETGIRDI